MICLGHVPISSGVRVRRGVPFFEGGGESFVGGAGLGGLEIFLLDLKVNFLAVDWEVLGRGDTDSDLITTHVDDHDLDIIANLYTLINPP